MNCSMDGCKGTVARWGRCHHHAWKARWPLPAPDMPDHPEPDWRERANCRGMDTEDFFLNVGEAPPAHVVEACGTCSVAGSCLRAALDTSGEQDRCGIRGGLTPRARAALRAPRVNATCGSPASYNRHYKRGEKPCDACREAYSERRSA